MCAPDGHVVRLVQDVHQHMVAHAHRARGRLDVRQGKDLGQQAGPLIDPVRRAAAAAALLAQVRLQPRARFSTRASGQTLGCWVLHAWCSGWPTAQTPGSAARPLEPRSLGSCLLPTLLAQEVYTHALCALQQHSAAALHTSVAVSQCSVQWRLWSGGCCALHLNLQAQKRSPLLSQPCLHWYACMLAPQACDTSCASR